MIAGTALRRPAVFRGLALCGVLLVSACGDGPRTPVTVSPTPTPAPVTTVVVQGSMTGFVPLSARFLPFTTSATGTVTVTMDWTFATNDIDIGLVRGNNPCTIADFIADTCPFITLSTSTTAKPETISAPSQAAGVYTLYAFNFGPGEEAISFQVLHTAVPGAAAAANVSSVNASRLRKGTLRQLLPVR